MADPNKSKALYSSGVAFLGFACFALAATAIGLPLWGYYENPQGKFRGGVDFTIDNILLTKFNTIPIHRLFTFYNIIVDILSDPQITHE